VSATTWLDRILQARGAPRIQTRPRAAQARAVTTNGACGMHTLLRALSTTEESQVTEEASSSFEISYQKDKSLRR